MKMLTSTIILIITNIITIILTIQQGWDFSLVMWIYWIQSITIGLFNILKIMNLKNFVLTKREPGLQTKGTKKAKISAAAFFVLHYGSFHIFYLVYLLQKLNKTLILPIIIGSALFLGNHLYSYYKYKQDKSEKDLMKIMLFPYARILPMQIAITSGLFFAKGETGILIFLSLKTIADVIMHIIEHKK